MKDYITIIWSIEDVKQVSPMTDSQARNVLSYIEQNHDANRGITWQTIEDAIEVMSR